LERLDDRFIPISEKMIAVNDSFWRSVDRVVKNVGPNDPALAMDHLFHRNF
jgi:hypothetical protein